MKAMFSAIADAFEDPPAESTNADVALLDRTLAASKKGVNGGMGGTPPTLMPLRPGLRAGSVFIHSKRTQEALPEIAALPATGVPALDAEFRRREEQTVQDMARDFSTFSVAGLAWVEAREREGAALLASRAAEDAEVARKRFEEDAARSAVRSQEDAARAATEQQATVEWISERELAEAALVQKWKVKVGELSAALEEGLVAHKAQLALQEQRAREEEARLVEEAARAAAARAQDAGRETESLHVALREAELARLRLTSAPSLKSMMLVAAPRVPSAIRFACASADESSAGQLRHDDRSWWRLLHFLEAEGLTPPLKGTDVSAALFSALDHDSDGAVACADAGYLLSLLCSGADHTTNTPVGIAQPPQQQHTATTTGTERSRVDASLDSPGAPAGAPMVSASRAAAQIELCTRVRDRCDLGEYLGKAPSRRRVDRALTRRRCAPLLLGASPPTSAEVVAGAGIGVGTRERLSDLFGGASTVSAGRYREWLTNDAATSALFTALM